MLHNQEMATSYHIWMSRYLRYQRTQIRRKHCWSIKLSTICWMLAGCHCWMCCLSRKLGIQRERKRLSLRREIPHWEKLNKEDLSKKNRKLILNLNLFYSFYILLKFISYFSFIHFSLHSFIHSFIHSIYLS